MKFSQAHIPLILVLLVGTLLRIWDYASIPYTYDEYSGLWRLGNGDLKTLLNDGIAKDAHPPLYMLFLLAWSSLVGQSEALVKLPFVLSGIASLWLMYKMGCLWFSANTGLIAAALLAVMQESVMHSQIARPYALGLLFVLLAGIALHRLVRLPGWKNMLWFGLLLALCAYTHHFSMLAATLLWVSAIFLVSPLKWLLYSALVALLLYAPNLVLLKSQLSMGGIGTVLAPPDLNIVVSYFSYLWHFSIPFALITCIVIFLAWRRPKVALNRWLLVCAVVVAGTWTIGALYSHLVAPVLQPRVLYFCLPFLLLLISGPAQNIRPVVFRISLFAIIGVGCTSLIWQRGYYKQFYADGFRDVLLNSVENIDAAAPASYLLCYSPNILERQISKYHPPKVSIVNPDSTWQMCDYIVYTDTLSSESIWFGWTTQYYRPPMEFLAMIARKYPHIKAQQHRFNASLYQFQRDTHGPEREIKWPDITQPWKTPLAIDSVSLSLPVDEKTEYGLTWRGSLAAISHHPFNIIYTSVDCKNMSDSGDAMLVIEVLENGKSCWWGGQHIRDFQCAGDSITTAWMACYSPDVIKNKGSRYELNVYLWNRGMHFTVADMRIGSIPGNPYTYSLLEDFDKNWRPMP